MKRNATLNDIPDWFWITEIYQKKLTLAEWADELECRCFLLEQTVNDEYNFDKIEKPNDKMNKNFIACAIDRNRDYQDRRRQPLPPISELPSELVESRYIKVNEHVIDAGAYSFPYPIVINLNYSKQALLQEFESLIDVIIDKTDLGLINEDNYDLRTKGICDGVNKRVFTDLGKAYKGETSYTEKNSEMWSDYCVLEYIDLFLWGELNNLKFPDTLLASVFWHQDQRRPNKYSHKRSARTVLEPVRPWVCELLNRRTVGLLRASATEKK